MPRLQISTDLPFRAVTVDISVSIKYWVQRGRRCAEIAGKGLILWEDSGRGTAENKRCCRKITCIRYDLSSLPREREHHAGTDEFILEGLFSCSQSLLPQNRPQNKPIVLLCWLRGSATLFSGQPEQFDSQQSSHQQNTRYREEKGGGRGNWR